MSKEQYYSVDGDLFYDYENNPIPINKLAFTQDGDPYNINKGCAAQNISVDDFLNLPTKKPINKFDHD